MIKQISYHISSKKPFCQGENWLTINDTVENFSETYDGPPAHLAFSDCTYHLTSTNERYGQPHSKPPKIQDDGAFARSANGFMNEEWDGVDEHGFGVAHRPETWANLARHLHPGGYVVCFHHVRTQHRLAMALEQAGLLIQPSFYNYTNGRVETLPAQFAWLKSDSKGNGTSIKNNELFEGYQYGGPLKPMVEPILIAQKPHDQKSMRANILATGAGALNMGWREGTTSDRVPGTVILTHHPDCVRTGFKSVYVGKNSITSANKSGGTSISTYGHFKGFTEPQEQGHADENGYEQWPTYQCHPDCHVLRIGEEKARFYSQVDFYYEHLWADEIAVRVSQADPVFYHPSVQLEERNAGCHHLPLKTRHRVNPGGLANDPKHAPTQQHNDHPTLKPILLCEYLARLFLPPTQYEPTVLVPFAGTGSEMAGLMLAGWKNIIGIEKTAKYLPINEARMRFFEAKRDELNYYRKFDPHFALTKEFLLAEPELQPLFAQRALL